MGDNLLQRCRWPQRTYINSYTYFQHNIKQETWLSQTERTKHHIKDRTQYLQQTCILYLRTVGSTSL